MMVLAELTSQRWGVAILSSLAATEGARFVALLNRLQIPRETLSRTLAGLIAAGFVQRVAGYGHPLRPEYELTDVGRAVARDVVALAAAEVEVSAAPGALGRWGLPALAVLEPAPLRFNAIARALQPVTARALISALRTLESESLVLRRVEPASPPAAIYAVSAKARALAAAAARLWRGPT
jgi:DNA-binding HxlR family transcriptional regulator